MNTLNTLEEDVSQNERNAADIEFILSTKTRFKLFHFRSVCYTTI